VTEKEKSSVEILAGASRTVPTRGWDLCISKTFVIHVHVFIYV
jgi:hypothetical protein